MPKSDPAHKETDKILAEMEKKLHSVYKQAYKEAKETADTFLKQFREMDKKKREQVKNGDLDKDEYARWRRTQVFQSNNYRKMADTLAADMTHSNQLAASVINGYLPEVYAVNYNYGTYEIEKGGKINTSFTLYDRQTVERLIRDNPDLLPRKAAVNVPKDEQWNKKHINSAVTQGILQGESIDKISQRLAATVTDMSQTSAIRNARTMTTSAQNGGRIDSYKRAESMGIKLMQVWLSTLDNRTRHEHILLDGQKRKVGEPFEVDGEKIYFPGDPSAEPYLVYNCRCTLIGEVKGIDYKLSDVSQRDNKLGDMTYEEWKDSKRKQDEGEPDKPKEPDKQEEKPIIVSNEFFSEQTSSNINNQLSRMNRHLAEQYRDILENAPKERTEDGTAYDSRRDILCFNVDEVDSLNGDIAIHEATHYRDFHTKMTYEHRRIVRERVRDENGDLVIIDGKIQRQEVEKVTTYEVDSATAYIGYAYQGEESQADYWNAAAIIGVTEENATPWGETIAPEDMMSRLNAYRQWLKDNDVSEEDIPHISDIMSSFLESQYPFTLIFGGHSQTYWNNAYNQYSECIAAYSVLKSRDSESLKLIEKICPNMYNHLSKVYKEMWK